MTHAATTTSWVKATASHRYRYKICSYRWQLQFHFIRNCIGLPSTHKQRIDRGPYVWSMIIVIKVTSQWTSIFSPKNWTINYSEWQSKWPHHQAPPHPSSLQETKEYCCTWPRRELANESAIKIYVRSEMNEPTQVNSWINACLLSFQQKLPFLTSLQNQRLLLNKTRNKQINWISHKL